MVFSVIITYGVYFASSMLALDPYHLVTCFAQYILLTPMYINVLNMYVSHPRPYILDLLTIPL